MSLSSEQRGQIIGALRLSITVGSNLSDGDLVQRLLTRYVNAREMHAEAATNYAIEQGKADRLRERLDRIRTADNEQHAVLVQDTHLYRELLGGALAGTTAVRLISQHYVRVCTCTGLPGPEFDRECPIHGETV